MPNFRFPNFKIVSQYLTGPNTLFKNSNNKISLSFECINRPYHLSPQNFTKRQRTSMKTPDLVYFPQVMRWLKTKIGFKVLQKAWDPEFSEGAFIYGSTRAICRITEVIGSDDQADELKDLVTPSLRKKLHTEMKLNLSEIQKQIIVLRPSDIKLLIPIEVRMYQQQDKKQCSVGLRSLAVKWHQMNGPMRLAIVALQAEFVRDYTEVGSEVLATNNGWTVRMFDILECGVVGDVRRAP